MTRRMLLCSLAVMMLVGVCPARQVVLTTAGPASLPPGVDFTDGDLVLFDITTNSATTIFDASAAFDTSGIDFNGSDINAFHLRDNGNIVLSTTSGATLGGMRFLDSVLVEYDPINDTTTRVYDFGLILNSNIDEDIDAAYVRDNGNIVFSTVQDADMTIVAGPLAIHDEDLVEFNPTTQETTLLLDGSEVFTTDADVTSVSILANGNIALSTESQATIGDLTFERGDVVEYDPVAGTATIMFDGSLFDADEDVDGFHVLVVPESSAMTMVLLAAACLFALRTFRA